MIRPRWTQTLADQVAAVHPPHDDTPRKPWLPSAHELQHHGLTPGTFQVIAERGPNGAPDHATGIATLHNGDRAVIDIKVDAAGELWIAEIAIRYKAPCGCEKLQGFEARAPTLRLAIDAVKHVLNLWESRGE